MTLFVSQIRRFIDHNGTAATIRQFTKTGTDSHGDDTGTWTKTSVIAVLSFARRFQYFDTRIGESTVIDGEIYIHNDEQDVLNITGRATSKKTLVDIADDTWRIVAVETMAIGLTRLIAQRNRE